MSEQTTEDRLAAMTAYVDQLRMAALTAGASVAVALYMPSGETLRDLNDSALQLVKLANRGPR